MAHLSAPPQHSPDFEEDVQEDVRLQEEMDDDLDRQLEDMIDDGLQAEREERAAKWEAEMKHIKPMVVTQGTMVSQTYENRLQPLSRDVLNVLLTNIVSARSPENNDSQSWWMDTIKLTRAEVEAFKKDQVMEMLTTKQYTKLPGKMQLHEVPASQLTMNILVGKNPGEDSYALWRLFNAPKTMKPGQIEQISNPEERDVLVPRQPCGCTKLELLRFMKMEYLRLGGWTAGNKTKEYINQKQ